MRVVLSRLAYGVRQVGQQREVQVRIAVGKKANFETGDKFAHLFFLQQQRRYRYQGGAFGRNAHTEVELGQRFRIEEGSDGVVDQVDGILCGRQQQEDKCRQRSEEHTSE